MMKGFLILVLLSMALVACETTEPVVDAETAYLLAMGYDPEATFALREQAKAYRPPINAAKRATLSVEPCDYVPTFAGDFNQLQRTALLANIVNNLWAGVDSTSFPDGYDWYVQAWSDSLQGYATPDERGMQWQWQPVRKPLHTDGYMRVRWRRSNLATHEDETEGYGESLNGVDGLTQLGMIGQFASLNAAEAAGAVTAWVGEDEAFGGLYHALMSWDEEGGIHNILEIWHMPWDKDCEGVYWRHPDSDPSS